MASAAQTEFDVSTCELRTWHRRSGYVAVGKFRARTASATNGPILNLRRVVTAPATLDLIR
jgi:hypothetical protein